MEYKDYYKTLGVGRDATQDEIKKAYRKLARKHHPDVNKSTDAEARFKDLGEAYEVLKDPEKRAAYDQLGSGWRSGQDFRPPSGWNPAGFGFSSGGATVDPSQFSDFFEMLFGGARGARARGGGFGGAGFGGTAADPFAGRGEDIEAKVLIDLEDAYHGATRQLSLQSPEVSPDGRISRRARSLNVRIPKGIKQGQKIRLAGQGGRGLGGEPGDLYLEVGFNAHRHYRVDGADVYLDLPVAPWEAALGAVVKVPTPSGIVDVKIPAGSRGGRKLRLKGRGIPAKSPGDFYVALQISLPPATSDKARKVYEEMKKVTDFNPRSGLGV
jgi:curved DNA-binding protein